MRFIVGDFLLKVGVDISLEKTPGHVGIVRRNEDLGGGGPVGRAKGKKLSGLSVWKKKARLTGSWPIGTWIKVTRPNNPTPLYVIVLQFGHRNLANRCQLLLSIVGIQFEFLHQTHEISFNAGTCR